MEIEPKPPTPWEPAKDAARETVTTEVQVLDAHSGRRRRLRVEVDSEGVLMYARGFGTADMEPGAGPVVLVEFRDGIPFVLVWGDISTEEPTHTIDLSGASENLRRN